MAYTPLTPAVGVAVGCPLVERHGVHAANPCGWCGCWMSTGDVPMPLLVAVGCPLVEDIMCVCRFSCGWGSCWMPIGAVHWNERLVCPSRHWCRSPGCGWGSCWMPTGAVHWNERLVWLRIPSRHWCRSPGCRSLHCLRMHKRTQESSLTRWSLQNHHCSRQWQRAHRHQRNISGSDYMVNKITMVNKIAVDCVAPAACWWQRTHKHQHTGPSLSLIRYCTKSSSLRMDCIAPGRYVLGSATHRHQHTGPSLSSDSLVFKITMDCVAPHNQHTGPSLAQLSSCLLFAGVQEPRFVRVLIETDRVSAKAGTTKHTSSSMIAASKITFILARPPGPPQRPFRCERRNTATVSCIIKVGT